MAHNASQVQLGTTRSSAREVDNREGNVGAGIAVRLRTDGTISTAAADGALLGISLGLSMSDNGRTAICRRGEGVPVRLTGGFVPTVGTQVHISDTTGLAVAAGAGATGVNAIFVSGVLTGLSEVHGGANVDVALIDMPGGL